MEATAQDTKKAPAKDLSKHKVLIVDDETKILTVAKKILRAEGYEVITSPDPEEAMVLLEEHDPVSVVLSDNRMPSMRGTEFFSKIKHLWPNTVRILMTAYYDAQLIEDLVNKGEAFRFLKKPLDFKLVKNTVEAGISQFETNQELAALGADFKSLSEEKSQMETDTAVLDNKITGLNRTKKMLMGLLVLLVVMGSLYPVFSNWNQQRQLNASKEVIGPWVKFPNGVAIDTRTNLIWMTKDFRIVEGRQPGSWEEAMAWKEKMNTLRYGGITSWRVPTIKEYQKTFDPERTRLAFDKNKNFPVGYPEAFENGGGYGYWSSEESGLDSARYFFFIGGYSKSELKAYGNLSVSVRLVHD